jgi:hypothetical protein
LDKKGATYEGHHRLPIWYSATISVNEEKNGRKTKNLTELSDPGSPNGSPAESENEFNQRKVG